MKKSIFKMNLSCGRIGSLESIFIEQDKFIYYVIKNKVAIYFGEVLGKHSEIAVAIGKNEIKKISDNAEFIKLFEENEMECGYNPMTQRVCNVAEESDICFDDWSVYDYVNYKINKAMPSWYK